MDTGNTVNHVIDIREEKIVFNAGYKPSFDIVSILKKNGYVPVDMRYLEYPKGFRLLAIPFLVARFARHTKGGNMVFQYPCDFFHSTVFAIYRTVLRINKNRQTSVAIVHDVDSIRLPRITTEEEVRILSMFDCVIVHSQNMKDYLTKNGLNNRIVVLEMFDYLVDKPNTKKRTYSKSVVFAGNLGRGGFLDRISGALGDVSLNLYGALPESALITGGLVYKGKFRGNDLSSIEGSWGLVWDGDSCEGLSGSMGEYLKYNYPHKTSLYICCGLPLIVHEDSAVAGLVLAKHIGITVRSISEISAAIDKVSETEYAQMCSNLKSVAGKVMSGKCILEALDKTRAA